MSDYAGRVDETRYRPQAMTECWACAVAGDREHMDNLVIRKRIGAFDDLSVVICLDCQMKVRQLLREIQEAAP